VRISPNQLPDDAPALKQIITAMAQDAIAAQAEIAQVALPAGTLSAV